jgi:hypothetical protein
MGELFQKKKAKVAAQPTKTAAQTLTDVATDSTVQESIDKALGRVTVIHGVQELPYDLAGKTVAYVREVLGPVFNIPTGARAYVNNLPVEDESVALKENDLLEFLQPSGDKG